MSSRCGRRSAGPRSWAGWLLLVSGCGSGGCSVAEGVCAGEEDCIMCMVRTCNCARMIVSCFMERALALLMGVHVRDDVRACRGVLVADCSYSKVPKLGVEYNLLTLPDRPAQQDACGKHGAAQMVEVAMREVAKTRMIMSAGAEGGDG